MNYLYHWVPNNMRGDVLYPLNSLKSIYPDLYDFQAHKYEGREYLMAVKVPVLDCLWNDVLHLTAIHPNEIKRSLVSAGYNGPIDRGYYQIDPEMIDPKNAVVFLCERGVADSIAEEECVAYHPHILAPYSNLPQTTKIYYREKISRGEPPLIYRFSPHILYRGSLNVAGLSVVYPQIAL